MATLLLVDPASRAPAPAASFDRDVEILCAPSAEAALRLLDLFCVDAPVCAVHAGGRFGGLRLAQRARTQHPDLRTFALDVEDTCPDRAEDHRRLFRLEAWVPDLDRVVDALGRTAQEPPVDLAAARARLTGSHPPVSGMQRTA